MKTTPNRKSTVGYTISNAAFALKKIQKYGRKVLRDCSKTLQDDDVVVSEAIAAHGDAIQFASERIRKDRNMAIWAVQTGSAVAYKSVSLFFNDDPLIALLAVTRNGWLYTAICPSLQNKHDIVCAAIRSYPSIMTKVPDKDILRTCLSQCIADGSDVHTACRILTEASKNGCESFVCKEAKCRIWREDVD